MTLSMKWATGHRTVPGAQLAGFRGIGKGSRRLLHGFHVFQNRRPFPTDSASVVDFFRYTVLFEPDKISFYPSHLGVMRENTLRHQHKLLTIV